MGHNTLQMTSRYIANNTNAHVPANQSIAKKIMSLIQSPDQGNPKESACTECKIGRGGWGRGVGSIRAKSNTLLQIIDAG